MSSTINAIVIGGSIAGLMHAVVLKLLGRNVLVLESRQRGDLQAGAAGLSLWPHAQKFIETYVPHVDLDAIAFRNRVVQTLNGDGISLEESPVPQDIRTTSWAQIHEVLWEACEKRGEADGSVTFKTGKRVIGVQERGTGVIVTYKNAEETEEIVFASLVIAADGARSFVRSQLMPGVEPEYAGYLAWRGTIRERDAPPELRRTLDGDLAMFMFEGSYVLA